MFKEHSFIIYCSNCNSPLVDIWVIAEGPTYNVRAKCPHCGDHSYFREVNGKFNMGDTEITNIGPIDYTENRVEIQCRKK